MANDNLEDLAQGESTGVDLLSSLEAAEPDAPSLDALFGSPQRETPPPPAISEEEIDVDVDGQPVSEGEPQADQADDDEEVVISRKDLQQLLSAFNGELPPGFEDLVVEEEPETPPAEKTPAPPQQETPPLAVAGNLSEFKMPELEINESELDELLTSPQKFTETLTGYVGKAVGAVVENIQRSLPFIVTAQANQAFDTLYTTKKFFEANPELEKQPEATLKAIAKARAENPQASVTEVLEAARKRMEFAINLSSKAKGKGQVIDARDKSGSKGSVQGATRQPKLTRRKRQSASQQLLAELDANAEVHPLLRELGL